MLKICYSLAQSNSIILNNKKTVCIKFGKDNVKNEKAVLNTHVLKWVDKVKHLENYMNKDCIKLLVIRRLLLCGETIFLFYLIVFIVL